MFCGNLLCGGEGEGGVGGGADYINDWKRFD